MLPNKTCNGRGSAGDHCCYINGEVCEFLSADLERDAVIIAHKVVPITYTDEGLTPDTEYTYRVRSARIL